MALNFLNLGRLYSVGNESFFFLKLWWGCFLYATEIWVWASHFLLGILGKSYKVLGSIESVPIGSVSLQQICRCPRGGKVGKGDKTLTQSHLSEKKGLAKRNPMVAGMY